MKDAPLWEDVPLQKNVSLQKDAPLWNNAPLQKGTSLHKPVHLQNGRCTPEEGSL